MHLLYVDDDRINLLLFEHACHGLGVQLSVAASGTEALEVAAACQPDLFVIDLHLNDTTGPELLHVLRADQRLVQVPAVLCSADDSPETQQLAQDSGFAACWSKPIDVQALRNALQNWPGAVPPLA